LNKIKANNLLKEVIKEYILEIKNSGSYPEEKYGNGHINDMMLDEEGWITDPNDRQKVKKWYLDMGLSHK
jgi:hypothetical protein